MWEELESLQETCESIPCSVEKQFRIDADDSSGVQDLVNENRIRDLQKFGIFFNE